MRNRAAGVPGCRWDGEHEFWCGQLGCQPRPALLDEQHEIAWTGVPQWRRPVDVVRVNEELL